MMFSTVLENHFYNVRRPVGISFTVKLEPSWVAMDTAPRAGCARFGLHRHHHNAPKLYKHETGRLVHNHRISISLQVQL